MPRYVYRCTECEKTYSVMHAISDIVTDCTLCSTSGTMIRQLTSATYVTTKKKDENKVGELTKEYIEGNKEILEQEKEKARKTTYEPT